MPLGEIVVTARKTTENLQKSPASIVAVSGADLQREGIANPQQLEKALPSVDLPQDGSVIQIFIRGIGGRTDTPNLSPASTLVLDGIPVPRFVEFASFFDLDSIQEIAGPQGTLYGGSAAGGAINAVTAKPRHDYSGSALLDGGAYGEFHGAVDQNMPLGDDVSLRASVDYDRHDGYYTDGLQGQDQKSGRLSLLAKPIDNLSILLFTDYSQDTGRPYTSAQTLPPPSDPWNLPAKLMNGAPVTPGVTGEDYIGWLSGANVEWRVGGNVFTYIAGFAHAGIFENYISSNGPAVEYQHENQITQELRWNRTFGKLQLTAGGFYLNDPLQFHFLTTSYSATTQAFKYNYSNITSQVNTSWALFAQAVYSVTDRLRITAGARTSTNEIDAHGFGSGATPASAFAYKNSKEHPDWKVGVDYDLAPRILTYANVQTGYVPFGYNPVPQKPGVDNTVPESRLLSFSAGVKSRFFNNHLELNDEFYYYDYRNFQAIAFIAATGTNTVLKAERLTIYGNELDARVVLPYGVEVNSGLVLQSAHYDTFNGAGYNYDGNQLADAPEINFVAGLQRNFRLGELGDLLARVQTHAESDHYGTYVNYPSDRQPTYTKSDFYLTYSPPRATWKVQAYVQNMENAAVFSTISAGATPTATVGTGVLEPPRTFGARVFLNW